jgi:hypothetical protein
MKLKRKNRARLASISALGAGALGVAGTAEAGTIQYTALDHEIGFSATTKPAGSVSTFNAPIVPGISAYFRRSAQTNSLGSFERRLHLSARLSVGVNIAGGLLGFAVSTAQPGQAWKAGQPYAGGLLLGRHTFTTSGFNAFGKINHNEDFYELFAFVKSSNAKEDYGWIHLNETVSSTAGPDLHILGIAYDSSGATIGAGVTQSTVSSTPEPSTVALASLSALALGAVGLRRWRAVRKQAA